MTPKVLVALSPLALALAACGGGGRTHFQSAADWYLLSSSGEVSAANSPAQVDAADAELARLSF